MQHNHRNKNHAGIDKFIPKNMKRSNKKGFLDGLDLLVATPLIIILVLMTYFWLGEYLVGIPSAAITSTVGTLEFEKLLAEWITYNSPAVQTDTKTIEQSILHWLNKATIYEKGKPKFSIRAIKCDETKEDTGSNSIIRCYFGLENPAKVIPAYYQKTIYAAVPPSISLNYIREIHIERNINLEVINVETTHD